jgi:hypothetical protein
MPASPSPAERLRLEVRARLDVDVPAAQTARQAHVLALLADRQRLLSPRRRAPPPNASDVRVDVVDVDRGGLQAVHDQGLERIAPADDVDALAAQLVDHRLDARAATPTQAPMQSILGPAR